MSDTKVCKICCYQKNKQQHFARNSKMVDGFINFCKLCVAAKKRKRRIFDEASREYDQRRGLTTERKEHFKNNQRKHREKYPEKYKARTALGNAVRSGLVVKPNKCAVCPRINGRITGHHTDYSKPLTVVWLCSLCHARVERNLIVIK